MSKSSTTLEDILDKSGRIKSEVTLAVVQSLIGDSFTIPNGMSPEEALRSFFARRNEENQQIEFAHDFPYRPMDGAYATIQVLEKRYGVAVSRGIPTERGEDPPELRTVEIAFGETVQVPWGRLEIPRFPDMDVYTKKTSSREYGTIFRLEVKAPRRHGADIDELFRAIEEHLKTNSIYRGQAIIGNEEPSFLDLSQFDSRQVVYSQIVQEQLETSLWSVLRYTDSLRRDGIPRKRAVLAHGPYGTGKTLAGQLTAMIATQNGWTFIAAQPGQDDLGDIMRTARLYQPAVVFFEDVDTETSSGKDDEVVELLDTFDGIIAKGGEFVILMTTNRIDRIHEAMFRPGRLDALIEIGALDRAGVERLVKGYVKSSQLAKIDYDQLYVAMEGFLPAFIREAITRASSVALARVKGKAKYKITTSDLVKAAHSLRPQLEQMQRAGKGEQPVGLEEAFVRTVRTATNRDDGR